MDEENSINDNEIQSSDVDQLIQNENPTICCDPRKTWYRFIGLVLMCFLGFGSYFCFDNPAALEDHLKKDLNISGTEYTLLYSVYSWPNAILCFVGGFLMDRVFGIRLGANIYMGITLVGQVLFATGVLCNIYWLMLVGRFVFGIGAESLAVAQNSYAVLWFKGKELNMVFGLQLSFARIGSAINFLVMESIYNWVIERYKGAEALGIVLFIATTTCFISLTCALLLGLMDKRAEKILRRNEQASGEIVKLRDIKYFSSTFWLVTGICVSYYVAIFPFIGLGKNFFIKRFHMSDQEANAIDSLIYLLSGVASPILGFLIDRLGRNVTWITFSVIATIIAHSLLGFTQLTPYVGMVLMSLAYACLAGSLWPLVAFIVSEYQLSTAYGVCQAIQNFGLAVFMIITGIIQSRYDYIGLETFFVSSLTVALLLTIALWFTDTYYKSGVLNMTPSRRLEHQQRLLAAQILEKEKFRTAEASTSQVEEASDFHIRNRYKSKTPDLMS